MNTIDEIYNEMKDAFEAETGISLNDGGDMALRFRTFAAQLATLQAQADYVERQCFPQTAVGEALDTHALQRGLSRMPASKAAGLIRFSVNTAAAADITIPEGTRCITASELEFEVTEDSVITAGSLYCDAPAEALIPGKSGNTAANTVVFMELAPEGVCACTNPTDFSGGCDEESDDALRERVLDSFTNAANSGNIAYYRNTAMAVDGVAAVSVQPRKRGRGTVDITVAAESGIPDTVLIGRVSQLMNGRREICVDVSVSGPTAQNVNVETELKIKDGYNSEEVIAAVESAIQNHFTGKILGKGLKKAELGSIIFGVEGVENYAIYNPENDVAPNPEKLPVLATLLVSEATE